MLETDNKNDATAVKVFDNNCRIQLNESENLIGTTEEKQKSQLRIEFNNLDYSVYPKGKVKYVYSHCKHYLLH